MLIYHDELRQWIGLKLDRPVCDQEEVQLVFKGEDTLPVRRAKSLADCGVKVSGTLYSPLSDYYYAGLAMSDPELAPDSSCHPKPIEPDLSKAPIPAELRQYSASITVDYAGKGHVFVAAWRDGSKRIPLEPLQAYVPYSFAYGRDDLRIHCAKGFEIEGLRQSPTKEMSIVESHPDGEVVELNDTVVNTVTYQCVRPTATKHK